MSIPQPDMGGNFNSPQRGEPIFNIPSVVLALMAICVGVYIYQNYILSEQQNYAFMLNFALIPARFSLAGGFADPAALFTLISYSFMHGGLAHIAVNMIWFVAFGSPLAGRIGTGRMIVFWILTSVIAGLTHYAIYPDSVTPLVGASGAISGMMGAAARYGFRRVSHGRRSEFAGPVLPVGLTLRLKPVLTFVGVWFLINIVTGLYSTGGADLSGIAWEAHIGGFVAGFLGIALLDKPRSYDAVIRRRG
ncbi:rhomboid family intramembrane serine protease [Ochrobactrum sp. Marseille-Q0166]|uniref:rhomboid family intramembrane serine protease n=1 Tax=Ochrobactrum sp. Marseille-Q0166 TaxID=2761105 RepID=UPI0016559590|nr:rhomboid family intramembrane serine protease [Ochrobactrum sp. Marseille-Q0166]MBC8717248.1 rhomboid family intramembrane serine protease [Ochrobactrum sp. Marseille-Q0166]